MEAFGLFSFLVDAGFEDPGVFIISLIPSGLSGDLASFDWANSLFMPERRGLATGVLLFRGETAISPGPLGVSGKSEKRE